MSGGRSDGEKTLSSRSRSALTGVNFMSAERNSESYKHDPELGCGLLIVLAAIFLVLVVLAVLYGFGAFDARPDLPR
jgi:hypothetical protein